MADNNAPTELQEADLETANGAGFLEPVITRMPKTGLVDYREEFGVERPKTVGLIGGEFLRK